MANKLLSTKIVGLVSAGHFLSHFYMLLIPPLFPLLKLEFNVSYTELGLSITVFSAVTGLTQGPIGFLVDRYGPKLILFCGIFAESIAFILIGAFPTYWNLISMMVLAGIANAVYHPAGYSILNHTIEEKKIGRVFSIHTAAGMLGNAIAPVTIISIIAFVNWEIALILCGIVGVLIGYLILFNFTLFDLAVDRVELSESNKERTGLSLIFSTPIFLGILFFIGISIIDYGITAFSIVVLMSIHNINLESATVVLSAYLFASPIGVLSGGWIADRIKLHHIFTGICLLILAFVLISMGLFQLSINIVTIFFMFAGFLSGVISPSRDMLIRSLSPPKETGKVFGVVSTGFNIGGIIAPPIFGYILDHYDPKIIFFILSVVSLLTLITVFFTGRSSQGK